MSLIFIGLFENSNLNFTAPKEEEIWLGFSSGFFVRLFVFNCGGVFYLIFEERKFESVNVFEDFVLSFFLRI